MHASVCVCVCVGRRTRVLACEPHPHPFLTVQPERHPLSEQLLHMIYVASQGGLPGCLFHLQKKELCWNVIRELGIKLTAAFCFPCGGAPPLDCGIWFLHSQPELSVGKDQLRKGHREGQRFFERERFLSLLLYLSRPELLVSGGSLAQAGLESRFFFPPSRTRHSTRPFPSVVTSAHLAGERKTKVPSNVGC